MRIPLILLCAVCMLPPASAMAEVDGAVSNMLVMDGLDLRSAPKNDLSFDRVEPSSAIEKDVVFVSKLGPGVRHALLTFTADDGKRASVFMPVSFNVAVLGDDGPKNLPAMSATHVETAGMHTVSNYDANFNTNGLQLNRCEAGMHTVSNYDANRPLQSYQDVEAWVFGGRDCPSCKHALHHLVPALMPEGGRVVLVNIDERDNLLALLRLEDRLGVNGSNSQTPVLFWRGQLFHGSEAISRLADNAEAYPPGPPPADLSFLRPHAETADDGSDSKLAEKRVAALTIGGVILAGLVDGLNPCAISTLVFLATMLLAKRVGRGRVALMGASYCAASFLTYFALGLGLLAGIRSLSWLPAARGLLNLALTIVLLALAAASLLDAWRYHRTGEAAAVKMKLPGWAIRATRLLMRRWLSGYGLGIVPAALALGCAVTILESVCTGQVYLPALALMAESGAAGPIGLLALYNLMFCVPMIAVFVMALAGSGASAFIRLGRTSVVPGKVAMGVVFLAMAALNIAIRLFSQS
jgi:hypothetical protein